MQCGGYDVSIFFDFEVAANSSIPKFRRPLLTEEQRESMSEWLIAAVSPKTVMRQLGRIDEACEAVSPFADVDIFQGPFGAFRSATDMTPTSDDFLDWTDDAQLPRDTDRAEESTLAGPSGILTPRTRLLFQSLLDFPGGDPNLSTLPMWSTIDDSSRIHEVFEDGDITINLPDPQSTQTLPDLRHDFPFSASDHDTRLEHLSPTTPIPVLNVGSHVPHDAVHLIRHYSTAVLTLLTPFRHSKTPWHVLFVPHVKSCLAALTLGESLNHASLCAFYATMSISAFSLGGVTKSTSWVEQGNVYLNIAREHVRLMLRTAYDYPKTAKYKHVLIALLSMVQVALVIGNRDQAECYFIEAEKFIRMKGLNRQKSRKVRLLHHCYVFERMFHESVYLAGTNSPHRSQARQAIESSGAMAYSHDSLSFRLGDMNDFESRMQRVKCREEGENDLHLQNPGFWPKTLYPEIFGVPENYVFALSLVIRLGQWRDDARHQDAVDALSLKEFLERAKTVERYIKQLYRPDQRLDSFSMDAPEASEPMLNDLLQAMQHALTIYFHRRIYDVEADMLQGYVVGVRDCLLRSGVAEGSTMYGPARLLWPAFIAACEAEDSELQASFAQWFQDSATRSGLPYFDNAKEDIERVWECNRNKRGPQITWVAFMRKECASHSVS